MATVPAPAPPPPPPTRHALGWPAGSIRALLGLGVLAYMWFLALSTGPDGKRLLVNPEASLAFVSLICLSIMIMTHYFTVHRVREQGGLSALGLPRGSVRFLLLVGYVGLGYYMWQHPDAIDSFQMPDPKLALRLGLVLVAGFFLGYVITGAMRWLYPQQLPPWFLDVQAWFALLGLILLGVLMLGRLINLGLPKTQIDFLLVEAILAGIVGFYFGARS